MTPDGQWSSGISVPVMRKVVRISIKDPRIPKPLREGTFSSGEGLKAVEKRYRKNPEKVRREIHVAVQKLLKGFPRASE